MTVLASPRLTINWSAARVSTLHKRLMIGRDCASIVLAALDLGFRKSSAD